MNEKEQLLANINAAIPVVEKMIKLENKIIARKNEIERKSRISVFMGLLLGFGMFIGIGGLIVLLGDYSNNETDEKQAKMMVMIFGLCILCIVWRFIRIIICKITIESTNTKLRRLRQDSSLSWLPETYRSSSNIAALQAILLNGRADSLKEALNVLEEDLHRRRMEEIALLSRS